MEGSDGGAMSFACGFCLTGHEKRIAGIINDRYPDVKALAAEKMSRRRQGGEWLTETKILFPGYVFCATDAEKLPDTLAREGLRFLLTDGSWQLQGEDEAFAKKLFEQNGVLGFSSACFVNGRIRILDGPLKDYEGKITRVDRRFRSCEVTVTVAGRETRVWLGYELVEPKETTTKPF